MKQYFIRLLLTIFGFKAWKYDTEVIEHLQEQRESWQQLLDRSKQLLADANQTAELASQYNADLEKALICINAHLPDNPEEAKKIIDEIIGSSSSAVH